MRQIDATFAQIENVSRGHEIESISEAHIQTRTNKFRVPVVMQRQDCRDMALEHICCEPGPSMKLTDRGIELRCHTWIVVEAASHGMRKVAPKLLQGSRKEVEGKPPGFLTLRVGAPVRQDHVKHLIVCCSAEGSLHDRGAISGLR